MTTETSHIQVGGVSVEVVRKTIKNLHLGVYPPNGRIRVAVPFRMSDDAIRLAVIGKLGWIKRHRKKFEGQPRQSKREMVNGESHYFMGRRYRLNVTEHTGNPRVTVNGTHMDVCVKPGSTVAQRERVLLEWYRRQLRTMIPPLLSKWEAALGVHTSRWGIKKMRTRWGTCNVRSRSIWINLELAKKPVECLESIIVHELAHLIERNHGPKFMAIMDKNLPHWKQQRAMLNQLPVAHEEWGSRT